MTIIDVGRETGPREADRLELADLLDLDPERVPDEARLADLGLDSLAMMSMLAWLESRGVTVGAGAGRPGRVGEVLSLLDKARFPGLSIRLADGSPVTGRAGDVPFATQRASTSSAALAPVLSNQDIRLTPVEPDDIRFLYALAVHPETCFRWRYRGAPPPVDRFAVDLWAQVLVQFVARRTDTNEPIGHLVAYGSDMGQGYSYVGAVFQSQYTGEGVAARGVAMFIRYMFHTFPLRKLYVEVPGFNWAQMRSGEGRMFQVEGIMRDHEHYAGRYWDRYLCAIYPGAMEAPLSTAG